MERKKCPVCGMEQEETFFCRQCGWDFTADVLGGEQQQKIGEEDIRRYRERLELLRENFEKSRKWDQIRQIIFLEDGIQIGGKREFDPEEWGYSQESTAIEIPKGYEKICDGAFKNFTSLKEIIMPDTVEEIGERAFSGCRALTAVRWSKGLKKIGREAFCGCSLETISFPKRVKEIGKCAFGWCRYLRTVNFSEGLKTVQEKSFVGCQKLTQVHLTEGVISVGKDAFSYCTELKKVWIPESLCEIWNEEKQFENIFRGCAQLRYADIPDTGNLELLRQIEQFKKTISVCFWHRDEQEGIDLGTFEWKKETEQDREMEKSLGLTVTIPYGYTNIRMCDKVHKIWIPDSVEEIRERFCPESTFSENVDIIQIKWSQKLKLIGKRCCSKMNIDVLHLPKMIQKIGVGAFAYCQNLREVYLPNTVRQIEADAFLGCPLRTVVMENGIAPEIVGQIKRKFPTVHYEMIERPTYEEWID